MESFEINVFSGGNTHFFEVKKLEQERCSYQVYENSELVAIFEPDEEEYLHVWDNLGGLDEEVIYEIGLKIEHRQ